MGDGWASVGLDVGSKVGLPIGEKGVDGPDILVEKIEVDHQGGGVKLYGGGADRFEDGPFHGIPLADELG